MSAWTNGTYTHKGLALLAKLTQGASLEITRAVAGTGYVSEANLARQTAVTGAKQTLSFKSATYPEVGVCKLPMFLTNDDVDKAYTAKQIGVYAKDPNEGEILYFICQSQHGTNVPAKTEMPDYSATWSFYFKYGQADNVAVNVDPSHTVTQEILDEVRVNIENRLDALENYTPKPYEITDGIVQIAPGEGMPMNVVTHIEPVQEGYGTPHPAGGGKNMLNNTADTMETMGVTFTLNADGSVTANGTATGGNATYIMLRGNDLITALGGKEIILNGCPKGGSLSTYRLQIWNYDGDENSLVDFGSSATGKFTAPSGTDCNAAIVVREGATVSNLTFYPMIRLATETDGTYDPYENVRPISGWDKVTAQGAGKNLLNLPNYTLTKNGVSVSVDAATQKLTVKGKMVEVNESLRTFNISLATPIKVSPDMPVTFGTEPKLNSDILIILTTKNNSYNSKNYTSIHIGMKTATKTFDSVKQLEQLRLYLYSNIDYDLTVNLQLEVGETATAYEPYQGQTLTADLPETVYGGTVDWNSGVATVDKLLSFTGDESWILFEHPAYPGQHHWYYLDYNKAHEIIACSHCEIVAFDDRWNKKHVCYLYPDVNYTMIFVSDDRFETAEEWKNYLAEQSAAGTPLQILTKANNATQFQLTPQDILALAGTNNIWSNTGDTTVSGRTDILWLTSYLLKQNAALKAAVEALETAAATE